MKGSDLGRHALSISVAAAMLAGCGGSQPPIAAPGAMPQSRAIATHAEHSGSWMLPNTSGQDLLYLSSPPYGDVFVYTYPEGYLTGTLSGFSAPRGECVDRAGDVFITNQSSSSYTSSEIYEYAHGGTSPIATLLDPGGPLGCSVDPKNGNLAVANAFDAYNPYGRFYGDVAIYAGATGNATMYYSSAFNFLFCGYDNQGDLYLTADGNSSQQAQLIRLASGSSYFKQVTLNTKLYEANEFYPSVLWDGHRLAVSSELRNRFGKRGPLIVYRLRLSGTSAKVVGATQLTTPKNVYSGELSIYGNTIVGVDYHPVLFNNTQASLWTYPKGGRPKQNIKGIPTELVFGVTVSAAPSH